MDGMLRPKMEVLPDSALTEAPVTHTVSGDQPYYLAKPGKHSEPDGVFHEGSKVTLISKSRGDICVVQDDAGRKVFTACSGLHPVA